MDKDGVVIEHLDQILPPGLVIDIGAGNGYTAALLTRSKGTSIDHRFHR